MRGQLQIKGVLEGILKNIQGKRGDTLGQIAESFGTRASKIRRWNNMKYGSHLIHAGQKLVIWVK